MLLPHTSQISIDKKGTYFFNEEKDDVSRSGQISNILRESVN